MQQIFELRFEREYEDREDTDLLIGVYATQEEALQVASRLREKPGFADCPNGFEIGMRTLGQTFFEEGFITRWGPPPKDSASEAFDLPAWIDEDEETSA